MQKLTPQQAREKLIKAGFVYNEVIGWEKIEIINRFGLDPDMKAIPVDGMIEEVDYKEEKKAIKDVFGKNTGEYEVYRVPIKTGKLIPRISDNFLAYKQYKKDQDKKSFAENINKPPMSKIVGIDI